MSMAQWARLDCSDQRLSLLYKFEVSGADYALLVTDLSRIYHEKLTKNEIIQRARDLECKIDPSQDDAQFRILLDKICAALEGQDGTRVTIAQDCDGDFRLSLVAPLPPPLESLVWAIKLSELVPEELQSHLIRPLVLAASSRKSQIDNLIDQLHEKDHVILKLLDRLEASSIDLTTIFPGTTGVKTANKGVNRESVAKYVKGFARFDEREWTKQSRLALMNQTLSQDVVENLSEAQPLPSGQSTMSPLSLRHWFRDSQARSAGDRPEMHPPERNQRDSSSQGFAAHADDVHQDEPQVSLHVEQRDTWAPLMSPQYQEDRLSQRPKSLSREHIDERLHDKQVVNDDDTTEDEEDEPRLPISAPSPVAALHRGKETNPSSNTSPPMRKLGMVGGRSKATSEAAPVRTSPIPMVPQKKRGALGVIGGKGKADSLSATPNSTVEPGAVADKINNEHKFITENHDISNETEEHKAARRREELKRSLETKPKAPKKKRKF
ncbi:MAG: hypothetical protein Q9165_003286 [Trypethelium subeluteriae]